MVVGYPICMVIVGDQWCGFVGAVVDAGDSARFLSELNLAGAAL